VWWYLKIFRYLNLLGFYLFLYFLLSFLYFYLFFGLTNFNEFSPTFLIMFEKPIVSLTRWSIHCSFNKSKKRGILLTFAIAPPYMITTSIYFIMELMKYWYFESCFIIDFMHEFQKWRTMTFVYFFCSRTCYE